MGSLDEYSSTSKTLMKFQKLKIQIEKLYSLLWHKMQSDLEFQMSHYEIVHAAWLDHF